MDRITIVSTSFPTGALLSGQEAAGSFVYDFAKELSRRVEVNVVAPGHENCKMELEGISVNYFAASSLPLSLLKPKNPLKWPGIIRTLQSGQRAVLDTVRETKPHHIFALWALPSGYWAKTAGAQTGTPYSVWALGSDIWSLGKIPLVRKTLRSVLRSSTHCFADGYKLAEDVTAISGRSCNFLPSCRKLPVYSTKEHATSPPYKLAFLGRWHRNKGIDLLLESLNLLNTEDWNRIREIRIHGGGPLNHLVNTQVNTLKNNGYPVTAGGYLNVSDAANLYQWADFLLIPSRVESIPVVFSDAMQSNCPVISMPVGDLPTLMSRLNVGVLSRSIGTQDYCNSISEALLTPPASYSKGLSEAASGFKISESIRYFLSTISIEEIL